MAMVVAHSVTEIRRQPNSAVTVGSFDGVHLGHREILRDVVSRAASLKGRSVVVTFDPHPREVVGRTPIAQLTSLAERLDEFAVFGVDVTLILKFTYDFSRLTAREFYQRFIIDGVGAAEVVEGHDHMFGRDREAGVAALIELGKEFGFTTTTVHPVMIDGEVVSSSGIRESLLGGDVAKAARFLGRPYQLTGTVVRGDGRGAEIGFPTANLEPIPRQKLIPADGVYFVSADVGEKKMHGMLNIGTRPTFTAGVQRSVEVHLFDFNGAIYGTEVTVRFHQRLRQEKQFSSKDEFITQLQHDRSICQTLIDAGLPT